MKKRELQFMDGKSSKFWRIELEGVSHTVTYGRIGADGTSKTKDFGSVEEAEASYDKLVAQKLAKGYVDAGDGASGAEDDVPFLAFSCTTGSHGTYEHATNFMGLRIRPYKAGKKTPKPPGEVAHFFGAEWDDNTFDEDLDDFLSQDHRAEARALVVGAWALEGERNSSSTVAKLVEAAPGMPKLTGLFIGDIIQEESEMSWIQQSDLSPLLEAFPNLQLLRARGGEGLALSKAKHERLRALALETGGMNASVLRSILDGHFPALEYLELWLGTEEYGGTCTVEDLQPLLAGNKFPSLRYLGLRNCDFVDELAAVVVNSPLLKRLQILDLSLGTLSDTGGQALLHLPTDTTLERLDLSHHFMSKGVTKQLKELKLAVDVSDAQEDDEDWRFVAVGE